MRAVAERWIFRMLASTQVSLACFFCIEKQFYETLCYFQVIICLPPGIWGFSKSTDKRLNPAICQIYNLPV